MPRTKGATNKNKQALIALLQAKYPDYHPVLEMAEVACAKDENGEYVNDLPTRLAANKEVAQYVTPKLKAVEMKVEDKRPQAQVTDEEWRALSQLEHVVRAGDSGPGKTLSH